MFEDYLKNINPNSDFGPYSPKAISIVESVNYDRLESSVLEKDFYFNLHTVFPLENSPRESSIQEPVLSEEISLSPQQKFKCGVCMSNNIYKENFYIFELCNHSFCISCLREYLELIINENKITKLKCLSDHCESIISEENLGKIISQKSFQKYLKFSKRLENINNPLRIICPYPDCEEYATVNNYTSENSNLIENVSVTDGRNILTIINPEQTDITISYDDLKKKDEFFVSCKARHKFCAECRSLERHELGACAHPNTEFLNYIYDSSNEHKRCPLCGIWIEKMIGCNHIVCTTCDKQWCWLCKEEFKQDHYLDRNSKCFGKMYEGSTFVRDILFENYDWFNEQLQPESHNNVITVNSINIQKNSLPVNQTESEFFVTYRKYFMIELKKFRNCGIRLFYSIALLVLLVVSNYTILTLVSLYLEQAFDLYNIRKNRLEKIKYNIINILISFCVWIYTYPFGILVTLIMYIRSIYNYVCGVDLNN